MIKKKPSMRETFAPRQQQSKPQPQPRQVEREVEAEDEDSDNSKASSSLADRFNAIASSSGIVNADTIPLGVYEAIVREGVFQKADAKGQSVRLVFELCDPEYKDQNQITQWYKVWDIDGEPFAGGIKALAFQFAKLGYKLDINDLEETLEKITEEKPGVLIKVSYREWQGQEYPKVNINGTCDSDVVQEYKDSVPY